MSETYEQNGGGAQERGESEAGARVRRLLGWMGLARSNAPRPERGCDVADSDVLVLDSETAVSTTAGDEDGFAGRTTEALTQIERDAIIARAKILALDLVDKGYLNPNRFPVPAEDLAASLGVCVVQARINGDRKPTDPNWVSGAIRKPRNSHIAVAVLESTELDEQKTFTLIHEIAHYREWMTRITEQQAFAYSFARTRIRLAGDMIPDEYFANTAAHMILMPDYAVVERLKKGGSIETWARHFGVTPQSMRRRLSYFDSAGQSFEHGASA